MATHVDHVERNTLIVECEHAEAVAYEANPMRCMVDTTTLQEPEFGKSDRFRE